MSALPLALRALLVGLALLLSWEGSLVLRVAAWLRRQKGRAHE